MSPSNTTTSPTPHPAVAWWLAARPKTLAAGVVPVLFATALAWRDGSVHWLSTAMALLCTVAAQVGTNLHNDYCDFVRGADGDDRLGPARAAQQGWLTLGQLRAGVVVAFVVTVLAGVPAVARGGWPMLALGVFGVLAALAYTGGPKPLAYIGAGDITVLVFFGHVFVGGMYYLHTLQWTLDALWLGFAVGLLCTAILVVNNLRDRRSDARAGKRTLVVRFGSTFGKIEYTACVVGAFGSFAAIAVGDASVWLTLAGVPLGLRWIHAVWTLPPEQLNPYLGKTAALLVLEGLLFTTAMAW